MDDAETLGRRTDHRRAGRLARRRVVASTLQAHGLRGAVAATVWSAARELLVRTRRRGVEHAVLLDADSGASVGQIISGTEDHADVRPQLMLMARGRQYVAMHTHPRSTSFSDFDIRLFHGHELVRMLVVVGVDDSWYLLSRTPDYFARDGWALMEAYAIELASQSGESMELAERTHRVVEIVAARHGLRYDRVRS